MFNIDAGELVVLVVLAVVLFGPEKMPQFARKAARVFVYLRDIANSAQTQLRQELGPEYSDLQLTDLNPKTFVKKHLSAEIEAIEDAKRELMGVGDTLKQASSELTSATVDAERALVGASVAAGELVHRQAPFDTEAT